MGGHVLYVSLLSNKNGFTMIKAHLMQRPGSFETTINGRGRERSCDLCYKKKR